MPTQQSLPRGTDSRRRRAEDEAHHAVLRTLAWFHPEVALTALRRAHGDVAAGRLRRVLAEVERAGVHWTSRLRHRRKAVLLQAGARAGDNQGSRDAAGAERSEAWKD